MINQVLIETNNELNTQITKQYTSWLLGTGTVAHLDPPLLKAFSQRSGGNSLCKPTRFTRESLQGREGPREPCHLSLLALGGSDNIGVVGTRDD